MYGHEDDSSRGVMAKDFRCSLDSVEPWHRDVADDHVRCQPDGSGDKSDTVLHPRDHVELRLQYFAQQFGGFHVVFGKQQAWVMDGVWNACESMEARGVRTTETDSGAAGKSP